MSEPRRHHIVPVFLLKRFANDRGKLWNYDKRRPESGVFEAAPKNIFVEKDLNSFTDKLGNRNDGLEGFYSGLEADAAEVTQKIIDAAERSQVPNLTHKDLEVWFNFFYHQQKRAPDAFARLGVVEEFDEDIERFLKDYESTYRPLSEKEKQHFRSDEGKQAILQHATVTARGKGSQEVLDVLAKRGVVVAVIGNDKKSFVVGDHPLARYGGPLSNAETELWLPISRNVAVSPGGDAGAERLVRIEGDHVRKINNTIYKYSNVVAGRSERLIKSLIGF